MIDFNKKTNIFHLHNKEFSYYIGINPLGILIHLYSGEFLSELYPERVTERYAERFAFLDGDKEVCDESYYYSELSSLHECASNLKADRRGSFITIEHHNNSTITDFRYHSHKIIKGKVNPKGLPHFKASENECETLIITLKDVNEEIYLELNYTLFKNLNVLIRSNKLINKTSNLIKLKIMKFYHFMELGQMIGKLKLIKLLMLEWSLMKIMVQEALNIIREFF